MTKEGREGSPEEVTTEPRLRIQVEVSRALGQTVLRPGRWELIWAPEELLVPGERGRGEAGGRSPGQGPGSELRA